MNEDLDNPVMPLFYHGRFKGNDDRAWIKSRMRLIPPERQEEIAEEYSRKFQSEKIMPRKVANTWLNGIAMEYRQQMRDDNRNQK